MPRTYVVTGAASGIGAATVARLDGLGHRTVTVDRRDAEVQVDLSTVEGRSRMVEAVAELAGGVLDAVVACAGTAHRGRTDVQVNYFGAVSTLVGLRPMLSAGSDPRAVVTTSVAVLDAVEPRLVEACLAGDEDAAIEIVDALPPQERMCAYPSSKRALARWVRRVAPSDDWSGAGIGLNTVAPGIVRTPMTAPLLDDPTLAGLLVDRVPMPYQGMLAPDAIAHHLIALTDPAMRGMTGQTVFVDGGAECLARGDDIY